MVYCGKPSRACLECRVKRRKCDFLKLSCGQCIRTRATCSGYRDQVALAFRDQSLDVARTAQASHSRLKRSTTPNSIGLISIRKNSFLRTSVAHDVEKHLNITVHSGMAFSIEEQAAPFFFHHYVINEMSADHIDCLALICGRASARGYLFSIIDAIGIASLSNLKKEPSLMYAASRKYSLALEKVRAGLAEPSEAISDQMLISVMLFTLYETVTSNVARSMSSWTNHVDGALTLLQLRGMDQLNSKTGRHLFLRLRTEVLVSCLQRSTLVPQVMLNWMSEAQRSEMGETIPSSSLANIIVDICALRATTKSCYESNAVDEPDLSSYISEALSIDADLAKWSTSLPALYNYSTTTMTTDREEHYHGLYHSYSDPWTACEWNLYRCARILVSQILTKLIPLYLQLMPIVPSASLYGPLLGTSNTVIYECITGIFWSVPSILGDFRKEQNTSADVRAACGLSLLWPLHLAGSTYPAQESLGEWAILQLEKIGNTAGLHKAKAIAMMLRTKGAL